MIQHNSKSTLSNLERYTIYIINLYILTRNDIYDLKNAFKLNHLYTQTLIEGGAVRTITVIADLALIAIWGTLQIIHVRERAVWLSYILSYPHGWCKNMLQ